MKKVLVLGCGPAGLLSAHAAAQAGHKVRIISKKTPSYIAGAQFLHSAIPDLTPEQPDGQVMFVKVGTEEIYAQKIYGDPNAVTSWGKYAAGEHNVWNLRERYHELWERYERFITDGFFSQNLMYRANEDFDCILSTIPLSVVIPTATITTETVLITGHECYSNEMEIVYNGGDDPWYRSSNVFESRFTEYPTLTVQPEILGASRVKKPLTSDYVNSWKRLHMLGRMGKWKKGVLVDDAYREAVEICGAL